MQIPIDLIHTPVFLGRSFFAPIMMILCLIYVNICLDLLAIIKFHTRFRNRFDSNLKGVKVSIFLPELQGHACQVNPLMDNL